MHVCHRHVVLEVLRRGRMEFDKWTDGQRRRILIDLLERCSLAQQKFCSKQLQDRVPVEALDFTTKLPRVLSLYIFSFLDPRSLCRCAQVSWHWKYLTELDQLWMLKCLRFGWYINFSPTPFEQGIWKKHYIEMVKELHVTRPKTPPKDEFVVIDVQPIARDVPETKLSPSSVFQSASVLGKRTDKEKKELPPWRSSDKHPTDIVRFNYLDNYDPIEQVRQARKKGGGLTPDLSRQAFEKKRKPSCASYKLRKAKSLLSLSADLGSSPKGPVRPSWATHQSTGYPVTKATAKILAQSARWNAGIRPAPVRAPVPKLSERGKKAFARMSRSSPWTSSGSLQSPLCLSYGELTNIRLSSQDESSLPYSHDAGSTGSRIRDICNRTKFYKMRIFSLSILASPLFEAQPWQIPPSDHGSDAE
ncbi:F-box only protein 16-like isoform X1 [Mauremys reevesii]|uniref:F-box only protein 16-like isoform X1 n=1 Tax=Mauremys reevesii TaxID=260615 RepID=UPI00193FA18D|nr:F-box only protein 16-like isoform X1 [Mauremys reevesii]